MRNMYMYVYGIIYVLEFIFCWRYIFLNFYFSSKYYFIYLVLYVRLNKNLFIAFITI